MIAVPDAAELAEARAKSPALSRHQQLHREAARRGWTRRHFLKMGAVVAGATGAGLVPGLARAAPPGSGLPSQLPYFSPILQMEFGMEIPFFLPIEVDPFTGADADPTTIQNFNGFLGLVEADGVSDPAQNSDGVARTWACDVRFMKGVFVNRAGKKQPGAFAFFWLDVFEDPSLGPFDPGQTQIHDFNPGDLNPPGEPNHFLVGGVFWTRRVPGHSIAVHPGQGDARFRLSDFSLLDYIDVVNAILRVGPDPLPASASVDIAWSGTGERTQVENDEQGLAGNYENATSSVQWSASNEAGYFFSTANSSEVLVSHAFTAQLRTGSFYP